MYIYVAFMIIYVFVAPLTPFLFWFGRSSGAGEKKVDSLFLFIFLLFCVFKLRNAVVFQTVVSSLPYSVIGAYYIYTSGNTDSVIMSLLNIIGVVGFIHMLIGNIYLNKLHFRWHTS